MKSCVALLTVDIFIPESHSLKDRRGVLNSIKDRIRARFNVSVCEISTGEKWQVGGLMVACVAESEGIVERIFSDLLGILDSDPRYTAVQPRIQYYA